jgi:hypothetical protein
MWTKNFSCKKWVLQVPLMQEPKAKILDINKSDPSNITRNIIAKI